MAVLIAGLGLDVYRQNHGTTGESLLNLLEPGASAGRAGHRDQCMSVARRPVVSAPSVESTRGRRSCAASARGHRGLGDHCRDWRRLTYVHRSHTAPTSAARRARRQRYTATSETTAPASDPESGGIVQGLQANGIATASGRHAARVYQSARSAGADPHAGHAHDKGKQPTYTQIETMTDKQLLPLFPAGTMTLADIPSSARSSRKCTPSRSSIPRG